MAIKTGLNDIGEMISGMPSWLLTKGLTRFLPEDHPWKGGDFFTLKEWAYGRTEATRWFDRFMWLYALMLAMYLLAKITK